MCMYHIGNKLSFPSPSPTKSWAHYFLLDLIIENAFLLYMYKRKTLESQKFSISGFWWIYTFWDVLNTIGLFLANVCALLKFCVHPSLMHKLSWNFIVPSHNLVLIRICYKQEIVLLFLFSKIIEVDRILLSLHGVMQEFTTKLIL